MDDKIRLLLLKLLKEDGDVSNLEKAGYQYSVIAREYSHLINEKLIEPNIEMKFVLSKEGFAELEILQEKLKCNGGYHIEPYIKYKTHRMDKYEIFLE